MTRISRISTPRATLFAIALITVVMLTFGAFSAEEAAGVSAPEGVSALAGEAVANAGECQPPTSPQPRSAPTAKRWAGAVPLARELVPPCPRAASQGETPAFTDTETE